MHIKEASSHLGLSARSLRHYEQAGLLSPLRDINGYRKYGAADLRKAARIRDMIATGFSTREIVKMAPCLTDSGAGACEAGLSNLEHKLSQIDSLISDLQTRRKATVDRIENFREYLTQNHNKHPYNKPKAGTGGANKTSEAD